MVEVLNLDTIGIIGPGKFGTSLAKLISQNRPVLIYARKPEVVSEINNGKRYLGQKLRQNISATHDPKEICAKCKLIFPVVPSENFADMLELFSPYLKPQHYLVHGTKGFHVQKNRAQNNSHYSRNDVKTMSELIMEKTVVLRIGCLAGPNLAAEILEGQPTATLLASPFDEVISAGKAVLSSKKFFVFGSHNIKGAEIAGALKNIIALGSGILHGHGLGKNIQAMLITRGLAEMIIFGKAMGVSSEVFYGTAGIGDLVATATSEQSRNFIFGIKLAQGESLNSLLESQEEVAEGVRTLKIIHGLIKNYSIAAPVTSMIYRVVFENFEFEKAIEVLMHYPYYQEEIDFVEQ